MWFLQAQTELAKSMENWSQHTLSPHRFNFFWSSDHSRPRKSVEFTLKNLETWMRQCIWRSRWHQGRFWCSPWMCFRLFVIILWSGNARNTQIYHQNWWLSRHHLNPTHVLKILTQQNHHFSKLSSCIENRAPLPFFDVSRPLKSGRNFWLGQYQGL